MNYLVMECHPGYAVVLSEDGRFAKVANLHYEVGQTVKDIIEVTLPPQKEKNTRRGWIGAVTALAACLMLMVTSVFAYGRMPYASVYMSINPEVRIQVNRMDRVLTVEGMNADGSQLLEAYDPDRKPLDTVMDELVDRAVETGYLHQGGRITLRLDGNEAWVSDHSSHLPQHLKAHLQGKITVTVDVQTQDTQTTEPTALTAPAGPIVIPVAPDGYGESDYGDSDYDESDYGDSDYGESDYAARTDYADSDYGTAAPAGWDDGDSGYAADSGYDDASDYASSEYSDYDE